MKLQILVPQYKETDEIVKPLLDSIALQQNVDFNEVGIIIVNDGSDVFLSDDFLGSYPFKVIYHIAPHRGVSATRNTCLDLATSEYVMFCDADDMFGDVCGLWMLFREMETGFDSIVSVFVEETRNPETGKPEYITHQMDSTFVHGKIHRRQYLIDQNIRWNEKLTIHEDSYFNILCQNLSENVKYCPNAFYIWRWRDDSVCRHDPKYILKTYNNMLDSNDALIDEFLKRGIKDRVQFFTGFMVFDAYYTMNKPEWIDQENQQYRLATEKHFQGWFEKHKDIWNEIPLTDKMIISNQVRSRSVMEGMHMENVTIDDWIGNVEAMK